MQFTIQKNDFLSVLQKIQGLTGRNSGLDITRNVLVTAEEGEVKLSATDLETGFQGSYSANVLSEGVIAINARKLYEIVKDFPSDQINLTELENRWVEISTENVQYNIVCANPEDFPQSPQFQEVPFIEIDAGNFKRMIERTLMVVGDPADTRPHINSALYEKISHETNSIVRLVSTDGSRLVLTETTVKTDNPLHKEGQVLIPKKELNEVGKFLDTEGIVNIGIIEDHFIFQKDKEILSVRLAEGKFPDYRTILNREGGKPLQAERKTFLMMLKRMSILSTEEYKGAIFNFSKDRLKITTTNPEIGESKEEIDVQFDSDEVEISFNPKFFADCLSAIEDEKVIARIIDQKKPCLIEGENDKAFLSAIMPMRI